MSNPLANAKILGVQPQAMPVMMCISDENQLLIQTCARMYDHSQSVDANVQKTLEMFATMLVRAKENALPKLIEAKRASRVHAA